MAAQCPGCNKFASLETNDPEVQSVEIDSDGMIEGEVKIVRVSSCCNEEMKEANFEFQIDPSDEIAEHIESHTEAGTAYDLSVEEDGIEQTERMSPGVDKKGKLIPFRFRKTFIGFSANFTVNCSCGFSASVDYGDDLAASGFDELV